MSHANTTNLRRALKEALSEKEINALGRKTGQSKRLRTVTPFRLVAALVVAFAVGATETIADLRREFNFQNRTAVAYKPFYLRLARRAFAKFMRAVVLRLLNRFAMRVLKPGAGSPLARFEDIIIQDGSSFAIKPVLSGAFPGRFKTVEPAAVEIHVTFSSFGDEAIEAHVSPDTTAERHFLPSPKQLARKLLLADRGYPSLPYFKALTAAGASFVMRLTRSWKPRVVAVSTGGRLVPLDAPVPLTQFLSQHPGCMLDLDVEAGSKKKAVRFRMAVVPGKGKHPAWMATNLPRDGFPPELVAELYRLRWQIELLFKEWKSYANLRRFDTGNKHIVRGLIWASLAAAILKRFVAHSAEAETKVMMSTRTVAMCARLFARPLIAALGQPRKLGRVVRRITEFLGENAGRAHPKRDEIKGRLKAGLQPCSAPMPAA